MKAKISKKAQILRNGIEKMVKCGIYEIMVSDEQFAVLVDAFEKNKKNAVAVGIFDLNVSGKKVLIKRGKFFTLAFRH